METKNIKKQAKSEKRNNKSLTDAVRRVVKDRLIFSDFAILAELYESPLTC